MAVVWNEVESKALQGLWASVSCPVAALALLRVRLEGGNNPRYDRADYVVGMLCNVISHGWSVCTVCGVWRGVIVVGRHGCCVRSECRDDSCDMCADYGSRLFVQAVVWVLCVLGAHFFW